MRHFTGLVLLAMVLIAGPCHAAGDAPRTKDAFERSGALSDLETRCLDARLNTVYQRALAVAPDAGALRARQRNWLKNVRGKHPRTEDVNTAYRVRIDELRNLIVENQGALDEFDRLQDDPAFKAVLKSCITDPTGAAAIPADGEKRLGRVYPPGPGIPAFRTEVAFPREEFRRLGFDDPDGAVVFMLCRNQSFDVALVDIDNDGVEECRIFSIQGTLRFLRNFFYKKGPDGQFKEMRHDYLSADESYFCDGVKLKFVKYQGKTYTLIGKGHQYTVYFGDKDRLNYVLRAIL